MWPIFVLTVIWFFAGLLAGRHFFAGKFKRVEWGDLPTGEYKVMCRCPCKLDGGAYLPSGTYRLLLSHVRGMRGDGHSKLKLLEISGCPPEMDGIKNGDTFDVIYIRKQKTPAHKKLTIYH
jgi:hypothetical protein